MGEPMSAERLAELRDKAKRASALWREDADDLIAEIDRLRGEVAALRERLGLDEAPEASGGDWAVDDD